MTLICGCRHRAAFMRPAGSSLQLPFAPLTWEGAKVVSPKGHLAQHPPPTGHRGGRGPAEPDEHLVMLPSSPPLESSAGDPLCQRGADARWGGHTHASEGSTHCASSFNYLSRKLKLALAVTKMKPGNDPKHGQLPRKSKGKPGDYGKGKN